MYLDLYFGACNFLFQYINVTIYILKQFDKTAFHFQCTRYRVVRELFTEARNHQPSIIVIDELESYDPRSLPSGNRDEIMFEEIKSQIEGTQVLLLA